MTRTPLDLAGIGVGPFNLSLAALLDAVPDVSACFYERAARFAWHPGMLLPDVTLQTSWLKDLVTAVHPTSRHSFAAYLVARRRFYSFVTAGFEAVSRQEFADYLGWVAAQLPSLRFATPIREIGFDGTFTLTGDRIVAHARNIVVGSGLQPRVPAWARSLDPARVFHSAQFALAQRDFAGRSVVVVGGGQSGAEIALHLLRLAPAGVRRVVWLTRRPNFEPLDEIAFSNEYFTPDYVARFFGLPAHRKGRLLEQQKLASDGASPTTLREIYRRLYALAHLEGAGHCARLLPQREAIACERRDDGFVLTLRNGFEGSIERVAGDVVICATGYGFAMPDFLAPIAGRIDRDEAGRLRLRRDFSVVWDGPADRRIFAQNAGRTSHGIAEPQLSLMAWRSATIVNALTGRACFPIEPDPPMLDWCGDPVIAESAASGQAPA